MEINATEARDLPLLMRGGEEIIGLCNQHKLPYWLDWGSLLGFQRHGNVIPWDNDLDLCMLEKDHQTFLTIFESQQNTIGELRLDPIGYGETHACCWLAINGLRSDYGIDVMAYGVDVSISGERTLLSRMSAALIAQYPAEYDFAWASVYPVDYVPFLGRIASVPPNIPERLTRMYGAEWKRYPDGKFDSPLCRSPWMTVEKTHAPDQWTGRLPLIVPEISNGDGSGTDIPRSIRLWWLLSKKEAEASAIDNVRIKTITFTDLVFLQDRALWGKVHMALVHPGEKLLMPSDWISAQRDELWL